MPDAPTNIVLPELFDVVAHPEKLKWQSFREGIDIYPIYNSRQGCSAALLRYAPGASIPRHVHSGYEHILVLSGEQQDEQGYYPEGTLLISQPGTQHAITSHTGCIVLAIWEKPVSFE